MILSTRPSPKRAVMVFFLFSCFFEILAPRTVFADSGGWGYGWYKDLLIYMVLLPTILLVSWLICHLVGNTGGTWMGNLFRSFLDLVSILYFSSLFSLFSQFADGLTRPFLLKNANAIVAYKAILLMVLLFVILFVINIFVSQFSRFKRVICNFGFCILVALVFLAISEPSISGPLTRWFINKDNVEKGFGHDIHHSIYLGESSPGKHVSYEVTWLQYYGFDEFMPRDKTLKGNPSFAMLLTLVISLSAWIYTIIGMRKTRIHNKRVE